MPHETEQPAKGGRLLRAFRLREGLSQEHLAQRAAVSPRTIRQIESDRSRPRPSTLKLLAEALKLPEDEWASLREMALLDDAAAAEALEPGAADQSATAGVPRQLPSAPGNFIGRAAELAELDGAAREDPLSTITGSGGIGKTWLALRWAHDNVESFPDGQLYINLRGFDPDSEAVAPAEALRQLLYALNAGSAVDIPGDLDSRSALYRSMLARRRMLVVLDNARDEQQVAPLLPGDSSCTTLVTSRNDLVGLTTTYGSKQVRLGLFDYTDGVRAVAQTIGDDRVNAEPEAATALVQLCGGLPLAIGILAARAATNPRFPLSAMVEELREEANQLDAFDAGLSPNLRSVFDASLRQLSSRAVRAFRLLGPVPTADIRGCAAASLLGDTLPRTRCTLRELETANLVEQHVPGRYRLQDLIRLYATEQSYHALAPTELVAALRRLIDHYVHTAEAAADWHLSPWHTRQDPGAPSSSSLSTPTGDSAGRRRVESDTASIPSA